MATMKNLVPFIIFISIVPDYCFAKRLQTSNTQGVCQRVKKPSNIAYDAEKDQYITVDVGECKTGTPQSSATDQTNKTINDCVPRSSTEERHLLYDLVVRKIDTIQTCQYVPTTCRRVPHTVTFYPGTAQSQSIDVGVCGGECRESLTCKAVWNVTQAIISPNGVRVISVIRKCSCVNPNCYRVAKVEAFPEQYIDGRGNIATRTKVVDMGACVSEGYCPGHKRSGRFDFRDLIDRLSKTLCKAQKYKYYPFVLSGGRHVNISTIDTCFCD